MALEPDAPVYVTPKGAPLFPALLVFHFPVSLSCMPGILLASPAVFELAGSSFDFPEKDAHDAPAEDRALCIYFVTIMGQHTRRVNFFSLKQHFLLR